MSAPNLTCELLDIYWPTGLESKLTGACTFQKQKHPQGAVESTHQLETALGQQDVTNKGIASVIHAADSIANKNQ